MPRDSRVETLLDGISRGRKKIVSPEGVPLDLQIAGNGERLTAFLLDMLFLALTIVVLYLLLVVLLFSDAHFGLGMTLILFLAFIVRNLYFLHFELAWQGRTPGKKICGLRVINRNGGELTPSAVIARNLTREVEVFLPLSLFFSAGFADGIVSQLVLLGWAICLPALPLFNREHLRAGDLIGGTQVVAMPRRVLLDDLTLTRQTGRSDGFTFTSAQLGIYGNFELQVLEEILRRPPLPENVKLMAHTCRNICGKIGWTGPVPSAEDDVRRFLSAFYAAERGELERGQLMGRHKADKASTITGPTG